MAMRVLALLLPLVVATWLASGLAKAETARAPVELLAAFGAEADRVDAAIERGALSDSEIERARARLEDERRSLGAIVEESAGRRGPLEAQLAALGTSESETEEPPEIAEERARLAAEIEGIRAIERRAEQGQARAAALIGQLNDLRLQRFREAVMRRGPTPLSPERIGALARAFEDQHTALRFEFRTRMATRGAIQSALDRLALPIAIALAALFFWAGMRRWLERRLERLTAPETSHARWAASAAGCIAIARLLLPAAAAILLLQGLAHSGLAGATAEPYLGALTTGVLLFVAALALGGAFFAPSRDDVRVSRLESHAAARAHRWLMALALVVALDRVLVRAGEQAGLTIDALAVLNAAILILGSFTLWRFVQVAWPGKPPADLGDRDSEDDGDGADQPGLQAVALTLQAARVATRMVAVVAPLLALAGYYGASRFLFYPVVFSGALIGLCLLIHHVVRETSGALRGDLEAGPPGEARGAGFVLILTGFVLSLAALPVLALIWGATLSDLGAAWVRLVEGFRIGETVIAPVDFLIFAAVFAVGYIITRALQGVVWRTVLPLTRFDDGAKSAMVAGMGYVGVVVSALIAISTTGLDLSNLAIVAGALSVGIGFGLQNIVNNFVSGIILLIERPIKAGDWVEIGGVHGTVKKVNVRSTAIQTFDRSTMFVPNADLISGTVTNWTHSNNHGRIIVGVSVAYGSDAREVETVLQEVAESHKMLMRRPAPYVVFKNFGADGLDFEIRGVLRDVNSILTVASDLRFEIYRRFEEAGIEIPFAQRDIHIRNAAELGAAIRSESPTDGADAPGQDGKAPKDEKDEKPDGGG